MARRSRERYTTQFGIGRSADEKTTSSKVDDIDDKWLNKVVEEDREKWKQSKWHTEILDEGEGTYESESSKPCSITKRVANDQSLLDQRESPCTLGSQSRPMATSKARMVQRERDETSGEHARIGHSVSHQQESVEPAWIGHELSHQQGSNAIEHEHEQAWIGHNVSHQHHVDIGGIPGLMPKPRDDESDSESDEDSDDESDDDSVGAPEEDDMPSLLPREKSPLPGLLPPRMNSGQPVTGHIKERHRIENKVRRREKQVAQGIVDYWAEHGGQFSVPTPKTTRPKHRGQMCPAGVALSHPAAEVLLDYAHRGCPVNTGSPWSKETMEAAIKKGPHTSALVDEAIQQLHQEVEAKVECGQCRIVMWDDIKDDPPKELKISPIAMIPHKSKPYRPILDVSFGVTLDTGEKIPSVNESSVKTAPAKAIDQLGHSLNRIIHAFAQADTSDTKIFAAKWDIKDGFWRLDCEEGEEWNFAYVLPQQEGQPVKLVVPTCLQMGWIESPPYFCAASETGRDIAQQYSEAPIGSLENHKFISHALQGEDYDTFQGQGGIEKLRYMIEVYVDDYICLAIPRNKEDLRHMANAVMAGVHDIFPADEEDTKDPISYKKLLKLEGMWALTKDILGFTFDGENKTLWLESPKRDALLTTMKQWIRAANRTKGGIPFDEFRSIIAKLRHAFISIPSGKGLLSPCNAILRMQPPIVYLHKNRLLRQAICDCRTLLRESTVAPTKCSELVAAWPDFVGVKDASGHGIGGVIVGENKQCVPTVFRYEWPDDIKREIVSDANPNGKLTNSDLECAGLLMLWLVMEDVCDITTGTHVALFSDNSPTVSWVQRLAVKSSLVAGQLIRALALRLKVMGASPLSTLHVPGVQNAMTDIPSRSFGDPPKWHCKSDEELLTLYNSHFPLPNQNSWTVYQVSSRISTRILSVLRMQLISLDEWRRLPSRGRHTGVVGSPMPHLWEWTLTYRMPRSSNASELSRDSQQLSEWGTSIAAGVKSELRRYLQLSQPLARRALWPME